MLQAARKYYDSSPNHLRRHLPTRRLLLQLQRCFRFLHVSTDARYTEVSKYGISSQKRPPTPRTPPIPRQRPLSDHLVRAWHIHTDLPVLTTNCSNNYGPRQFPEKLIPLMIRCALAGKELPVYGDGKNIRDWLYVGDHCAALCAVMTGGMPGETYNIGGNCEKTNIGIVTTLCSILDELRPKSDGTKYNTQVTFVKDRPGHDLRYAIDASKIKKELGWEPRETFETGIRKTISWYLDRQERADNITG